MNTKQWTAIASDFRFPGIIGSPPGVGLYFPLNYTAKVDWAGSRDIPCLPNGQSKIRQGSYRSSRNILRVLWKITNEFLVQLQQQHKPVLPATFSICCTSSYYLNHDRIQTTFPIYYIYMFALYFLVLLIIIDFTAILELKHEVSCLILSVRFGRNLYHNCETKGTINVNSQTIRRGRWDGNILSEEFVHQPLKTESQSTQISSPVAHI